MNTCGFVSIRFCVCGYALALALMCVNQSDARDLATVAEFQAGGYTIPMGREVRADQSAASRVAEFAQRRKMEKAAQLQKLAAPGGAASLDALPEEHYELQEKEECNQLLALCEATSGTDAGLTAVLLLGGVASQWSNKVQTPAVETALGEMQTSFPDTWQARIAPLLKAELIIRRKVSGRDAKAANVRDAVRLLRDNLPPIDYEVDAENLQVVAVTNVFRITFPLRAAYLVSIAQAEYNIGSSGDSAFLTEAHATCRQIIVEYPETPHAEWAKDIADRRIPTLLRMMGAP